MKNTSAVLRCQRINKWVAARRGRMTLLADSLGRKRDDLYKLVAENRLSVELINAIERAQLDIEALESECTKEFPKFKRFVKKGGGRIGRLSKKLNIPVHILRGLADAKGDGIYLMIKYQTHKIASAVRECEIESKTAVYSVEKIDVRVYMEKNIKNKLHTFEEVIELADAVRDNADRGNHDGALICRQYGDKYKILSIGFDFGSSNMAKSHVCDKLNPHVHALLFASLNLPKQDPDATGDIVSFGHHAPCPNCADRLLNAGVKRAYCLYEPELMGGMSQLAMHFVPVIKYSVAEKTFRTMNECGDAA
ncbi:hypothetical protein [Acinetobacter sp. ANC 3813]|uniref:hypothetical protein n=1 Tax=Acinetobacter sp. ANC 3813 TaxID=1977873 RepID=UPI000A32CA98|nr:hypothetical protein [Acinetobacter sp. ANC 3813]OTG87848.1 hypothetical protein B9T34_16055 [Acinetobacter sp. ANC 3813]